MRSQNLVDEGLFSFPSTWISSRAMVSFGSRSPTQLILSPQLPEAVVLEPGSELGRIEPRQLGPAVDTIGNQDVLWLEVVEEERRLGRNDDLGFHCGLLDQKRAW